MARKVLTAYYFSASYILTLHMMAEAACVWKSAARVSSTLQSVAFVPCAGGIGALATHRQRAELWGRRGKTGARFLHTPRACAPAVNTFRTEVLL